MKKGYLAAAALLGAVFATDAANAVKIRVDENSWMAIGVRGVIDAKFKGDRGGNDKADTVFGHRFARAYGKGKINKMIGFGWQTEFARDSKIEIIDSFMTIKFANELMVMAGSYKLPFERHSGINSGWAVLFPTGTAYGHATKVFTNPTNEGKPFRSGSRSAGLTLWGNVAGGMIKYYAGVFDATDETSAAGSLKPAFAVRLQFTPTMLGFKPEKGYVLKDTYVGKKNVLTVGLSYATQKVNGGATGKSLGLDVLWEQKMGAFTPHVSLGFVDHKDFRGKAGDDRRGYLAEVGVIFNQPMLFGKPAVVAKWSKADDRTDANKDTTNIGVALVFFIKGPTNKIGLAVDQVDHKQGDDYTDVTLSLFYNF